MDLHHVVPRRPLDTCVRDTAKPGSGRCHWFARQPPAPAASVPYRCDATVPAAPQAEAAMQRWGLPCHKCEAERRKPPHSYRVVGVACHRAGSMDTTTPSHARRGWDEYVSSPPSTDGYRSSIAPVEVAFFWKSKFSPCGELHLSFQKNRERRRIRMKQNIGTIHYFQMSLEKDENIGR